MPPSLTSKSQAKQKKNGAGTSPAANNSQTASQPAPAKGVPLFLRHQNTPERDWADGNSHEQEAEQQANRMTPPATAVSDTLPSDGRLPAELADHYGAQLGVDLSDVRLHTNDAAAETAASYEASAVTSGNEIAFGRGEYAPNSATGRQLLAHELTHVRQQRQGAAPAIQRKGLASAAAKQRKQLSAPSTAVPLSPQTVATYFQTLSNGKWGQSISAPSGVTVSLSGVDAQYKVPMTSLAMYMDHQMTYNSPVTGKQMPVFGPNLTVTVQLALATHGLVDGAYRFAWVGDRKTGTIFIELLTSPPTAKNQPVTKGSTITVGGATFTTVGTWPASRKAHLEKALSLIPASGLKIVTGMKFKLDPGGSQEEGGHYDQTTHTVHLNDKAFTKSAVRYGDSVWAVQAIVHEIGHAIDLVPMEKAWQQANKTNSTGKLKKVVSPSGSKWHKPGKDWEVDGRIKKIDNAFRKAAKADGAAVTSTQVQDTTGKTFKLDHLKGGLTEYSNKNWEELYAESFAYYVTSPATLNLIRPNIYKYFQTRFP